MHDKLSQLDAEPYFWLCSTGGEASRVVESNKARSARPAIASKGNNETGEVADPSTKRDFEKSEMDAIKIYSRPVATIA